MIAPAPELPTQPSLSDANGDHDHNSKTNPQRHVRWNGLQGEEERKHDEASRESEQREPPSLGFV
jgi:hypothetical protein